MPFVSVIVLNWNGKHLLERCLPSVLGQDYRDYEVVLFDNGSTDGSPEWVSAHFPAVWVLCSDENVGFSRGNNQAIRATDSSFVVLLNNDADPAPKWLSELIAAATSDPSVGMCASKLVRADDPTVMDTCGIEVDRAGIGWDRYSGEPERTEETEPYEIFGPCGGAALYRREMLDQVGLLDEDYFIYYEDIDLAWRAQRAGWRCLYVPSARVVHRHAGTVGERSPFKQYLLGRNKLWTIVKNYSWPGWLLHLPWIVAYDTGAWLYALLRGDIHPLRGRLAALGQLGRFLRKRREIQASGPPPVLVPIKNPVHLVRTHRWRQRASE